jgi:dihydrofolate synthase/folylpolyglutamate synthase
MTYKETVDYLFTQLPMYHRIGAAAYKKDLHNTLALCAHLGNPETKFHSIHVAGTNGKGSVSHMLAAICQAAGLKTGLYVSPHYKDFRERIRINGKFIPQQTVVKFVEQNRAAIEQIEPSFFEMTVGLAFDFFAKEKVDIAIIEVGLGGRLDSTNVITPLASVITNISYDHMNLLGDTLPKIAFEKAGIIKPGVPVIIGEAHPESAPVFREKARAMGAPIYFADQQYDVEILEENLLSGQTRYRILKGTQLLVDDLWVDASGPFQAKNLATVLETVEVLKIGTPAFLPKTPQLNLLDDTPRTLSLPDVVKDGLGQLRALVNFQGRWQTIGQNPLILCDSAHNEAGLKEAFAKVQSMHFQHLHIVTGFANDKDLSKALPLFPKQATYYFAKANIPRGLEAEVLSEQAQVYGLHGKPYRTVKNALNAAKAKANPEDMILVIGSIFVVAEVI